MQVDMACEAELSSSRMSAEILSAGFCRVLRPDAPDHAV